MLLTPRWKAERARNMVLSLPGTPSTFRQMRGLTLQMNQLPGLQG